MYFKLWNALNLSIWFEDWVTSLTFTDPHWAISFCPDVDFQAHLLNFTWTLQKMPLIQISFTFMSFHRFHKYDLTRRFFSRLTLSYACLHFGVVSVLHSILKSPRLIQGISCCLSEITGKPQCVWTTILYSSDKMLLGM